MSSSFTRSRRVEPRGLAEEQLLKPERDHFGRCLRLRPFAIRNAAMESASSPTLHTDKSKIMVSGRVRPVSVE